jgi:hypothetical protein
MEELRQLAQGLHPRALSEHGLAGALTRLADGSPVPVELSVASSRLGPQVEAAGRRRKADMRVPTMRWRWP